MKCRLGAAGGFRGWAGPARSRQLVVVRATIMFYSWHGQM